MKNKPPTEHTSTEEDEEKVTEETEETEETKDPEAKKKD